MQRDGLSYTLPTACLSNHHGPPCSAYPSAPLRPLSNPPDHQTKRIDCKTAPPNSILLTHKSLCHAYHLMLTLHQHFLPFPFTSASGTFLRCDCCVPDHTPEAAGLSHQHHQPALSLALLPHTPTSYNTPPHINHDTHQSSENHVSPSFVWLENSHLPPKLFPKQHKKKKAEKSHVPLLRPQPHLRPHQHRLRCLLCACSPEAAPLLRWRNLADTQDGSGVRHLQQQQQWRYVFERDQREDGCWQDGRRWKTISWRFSRGIRAFGPGQCN